MEIDEEVMRAVGKARAAGDTLQLTHLMEDIVGRLGLPASERSAIERKIVDEAAIAGVAVAFGRRK